MTAKRDLAQRGVVCKGRWWRWMPGMLEYGKHARCIDASVPGDGRQMVRWARRHGITDYDYVDPDAVPDFDDDATRGCLLSLAREAWDDPTLTPRFNPRSGRSGEQPYWDFCPEDADAPFIALTEVGVLVAALVGADHRFSQGSVQ